MPRKPAPVPPEALLGVLQLLAHVAEPEMMAAAIPLVRERLALTPEKLSAMLLRLIAPDLVLEEREEQRVRGVSDKTLKAMKDGRELPRILQGEIIQGTVPRPV